MAIAFAILSGLLLWSGFPPFDLVIGPFIGAAILFRLLSRYELRRRWALSCIAGFSFFAPLLHWSGSYVGWLPWVLLALLQTGMFTLISVPRFERTVRGSLLFASAFTVIELLRMKFPFGGFGWGRVGHTQVDLFSSVYPLVGVAGITFLVTFLSALVILASRQILVVIFILPIALLMPKFSATGNLSVTAIQGGVDKLGFDYNERALGVLNRHVDRTLSSSSRPELFIWPENASDIDPIVDTRAKARISEVLETKKIPLLVGAVLRGVEGPKNVSILYQPSGEIASMYIKQDLAPFGEYMPLRTLAERIAPEAKRVRDFQPGSTWTTHEVAGYKFISLICFEVLDDDFIRNGAKDAAFLVAQTNNATFGKSAQAAQQLQIIRARAAELRRDIAVVSTTGFSAHIDSSGSIEKELVQFQPGELNMEISTYESRTVASRLGSWFWLGLFGLVLITSRRSVFSR